jgi:hypothetical protein
MLTPETPRRRKKKPRQLIEDSLKQFDEMLSNPALKEAKRADLLIQKSVTLAKLLDLDAENDVRRQAGSHDDAVLENITLKTQHEKDIIEIERLKTANLQRNLAHTNAPTDPRIAEGLKTIARMEAFIKFLGSESRAGDGNKAKMSIAVILKFGRDSREYVQALGINFDSYWSNLNNPTAITEQNLKSCISPPKDEDLHASLCRPPVSQEFAVAALAVLYRVDTKTPARRGANSPRDYMSLASEEFNN